MEIVTLTFDSVQSHVFETKHPQQYLNAQILKSLSEEIRSEYQRNGRLSHNRFASKSETDGQYKR